MSRKRVWQLGILVVLCVAAYGGYLAYKRATWFPGRFLVPVSGWYVFAMDADGIYPLPSGVTQASSKQESLFGFPGNDVNMYRLSLSRDKKRAAYFREEMGFLSELVIRKVGQKTVRRSDWGLEGGRRVRWQSLQTDTRVMLQRVDVRKLRIPFCPNGNPAWSPDGRQIAFADNNRLYVVNVADSSIRSAALPAVEGLDALWREWREYERKNPLDQPYQEPPKASSNDKGFDADIARIMEESNTRWTLGQTTVKPSDKLRALLTADICRVKTALGVSPSDWDKTLREWSLAYEVCSFEEDERTTLYRRFGFVGREITWAKQDTIYCGNLRLQLNDQPSGKLKLAVSKLPVPSGSFHAPLWSPNGEKAAYYVGTHLVVVDAAGKVVWRKAVRMHSGPRWSQDGKFLAISCIPKWNFQTFRWIEAHFTIFEVGTENSWNAPVKRDVEHLTNLSPSINGWDWEL